MDVEFSVGVNMPKKRHKYTNICSMGANFNSGI